MRFQTRAEHNAAQTKSENYRLGNVPSCTSPQTLSNFIAVHAAPTTADLNRVHKQTDRKREHKKTMLRVPQHIKDDMKSSTSQVLRVHLLNRSLFFSPFRAEAASLSWNAHTGSRGENTCCTTLSSLTESKVIIRFECTLPVLPRYVVSSWGTTYHTRDMPVLRPS